MRAYLIQRAKFKGNSNKFGLDGIIELGYIGAAEFEFGALLKSLKEIRNNNRLYHFNVFYVNGKAITVYCRHVQVNEIQEYLDKLGRNEFHLHEHSDFNYYVNPSKYMTNYTDFWWDIENNIMFWKKNEEFEKKFKEVITVKPIKK